MHESIAELGRRNYAALMRAMLQVTQARVAELVGMHESGLSRMKDGELERFCAILAACNPHPRNWRKPVLWEREHEAFMLAHGRRRRVFCASVADVFDNEVDAAWRADLFALIEKTPNLDWLVLTKRIGNAADMMFLARGGHLPLLPNVWLGATICNQEEADRDIPKLLATPAAVRFLSIEPMLGPVNLTRIELHKGSFTPTAKAPPEWRLVREVAVVMNALKGSKQLGMAPISWAICGGESGPHARPMNPDWVRSLRDQCAAAGVAFHFKQWGEWAPYDRGRVDSATLAEANSLDSPLQRFGTKLAGRLLDGSTHDAFPMVAA